jgi:uncharacterized damage-inducible protein DinB
MSELAEALIGSSAAAPPSHILEGLEEKLAHATIPGAPHTIYQELWHLAFWQQITLEWIDGKETPYPAKPALGFASDETTGRVSWQDLCRRFLEGSRAAAAIAHDADRLERPIRCPSPPEKPVRTMSVRDQLISLAAHNSYHLGRIVLLRQLHHAWPPASGGFSW